MTTPTDQPAAALRTERKLLSVCVPVFNEEENIRPFYEAVRPMLGSLADRYDYEIVFTDNHSTDRTFAELQALCARDPRVRALRFSRNFGYQASILTGYLHCKGDAAVQLDVDLQDPPAMVPDFVRLWENGAKVVYGVRRTRDEPVTTNLLRKIFYRVINAMSEYELPQDAGDFRLVDRRIIEELRLLDDAQPYLRGSITTMGFTQVGVPYDRAARQRGVSKFPWRAMMTLAVDGIANHSIVPLRLASFVGFFVSLATMVTILVYAAGKLLFARDWPAGWTTTVALILLGISLNGLFLGIIGEYLGRIYRQVKRKPIVIIEARIDPNPPA